MVDQAVNVLPQIKSGNIKALGVSTTKRLSQLPDVPTIDESGLKGYEVTIWNGFFAPKGTPKDVVAKLNQALVTTLSDEKIKVRLTELAVDLPTAQEATARRSVRSSRPRSTSGCPPCAPLASSRSRVRLFKDRAAVGRPVSFRRTAGLQARSCS